MASTLDTISDYVTALMTPTVRLGVTGLSRAGKTVFITALVRNLTGPHRLPFFSASVDGRLQRAFLEPQPDDDLPRFAYERHLAALTGVPPEWPNSTRRISQLRLTLQVKPRGTWASLLGTESSKLHLDIVDYPGEWLLDLALMDESYEQWAAGVLSRMGRADHSHIAREFAAAMGEVGETTPFDDVRAERMAKLFADYLIAARKVPPGLATLGPGRFLMPGDLEGSPLLTFAPLPATLQGGPFHAEFARRFEAYKTKVVQPFFKNHFAKLDRQIVLVDALSALNGGRQSLQDLSDALEAALAAFRPGTTSWLGRLIGEKQIDRVLFAATKADHLPQTSHNRLEDILRLMTRRASGRATVAGADVGVLAVAALRATQETRATVDGEDLACIRGVPLAGEVVGDETFDGTTAAAIFPGDLPDDAETALAAAEAGDLNEVAFVKFRPPVLQDRPDAAIQKPWPHIRLDRALEFLIADKLP